ncbi:amidohydrolase [Thalassotalea euphylliae]|uniref:Amidohydrolase n=1 Tax=Thalassotalea euphylliae TaxID=1655234 RepID=A0A3E0TSC6_9GAMM|nr:amidohydrolase family protein [Thalassotalea euphylliae]REL27290.1 amidohydrolase [Thalassotalea euphylliae]
MLDNHTQKHKVLFNNTLNRKVLKRTSIALSLLAGLTLAACNKPAQQQAISANEGAPAVLENYDVLIINGQVYSGENKAPQQLAVGIRDDRIAYLAEQVPPLTSAETVIDATGKMVTPGFIDPHTHSLGDLKSDSRNSNVNYLTQGVTTVFNGNDGGGTPYVSDLLTELEGKGIGTNNGNFVGHGTVRKLVMGREDRKPTEEELAKMKALISDAMQQGAFGLSTGLFYVPGTYANTEEVIELSKVAAQYGGVYESHVRDESTYSIGVKGAIAELIEIGDKAKIPVHIAHIKALGVDVWGQSKDIIDMVEAAQQRGQIVTADQYPWRASSTRLQNTTVPRWALEGQEADVQARLNDPELLPKLKAAMKENIRRRGGPDSLLIVTTPHEGLRGKTIADLSTQWEISPVEAVLRVLRKGVVINPTRVASFNMNPEDIKAFMTQPWVMTSSDGTDGHPRKYASFPEKYANYVVKQQLMPVETFVYKSSGQVADTFGIRERGYLKEGFFADISIIDPVKYRPKADFSQWNVLTQGVDYQWVNGEMTIDQGKYTGKLPGKGLRFQK